MWFFKLVATGALLFLLMIAGAMLFDIIQAHL